MGTTAASSATSRTYLAVDLGASSGRVLAGQVQADGLQLRELHRFANGPVAAGGYWYWDVLRLWSEILQGLRIARDQYGSAITSLGVDTWGVDFALLGSDDQLLGNPRSYRDPQFQGMIDHVASTVSRDTIFAETGVQFMDFNTLYQLAALRRYRAPSLDQATTFLMMPDLFHWLLTGVKSNEFTNATTTQFLNPQHKNWARGLLDPLQIPTHMLQGLVFPGTRLGGLRGDVVRETGLAGVEVVVPGTHDTASAVAAVPATPARAGQLDWCYISSGTWSLMGAEVAGPIMHAQAREYNFTNEGGIGGTIRLLKNITGLWLVQECRRVWAQRGHEYAWDQLTSLAEQAEPLRSFVNPDDPAFAAPTDMPAEIAAYCRRTGQIVPDTPGAIIRTALESMALRYRMVLEWLEELTGAHLRTIHVVGGGSQNRQLCQMTAEACNRLVLAGPVEATAIGNVLVQAVAAGELADMGQARTMLSERTALGRYEPEAPAPWDNAYERFLELFSR